MRRFNITATPHHSGTGLMTDLRETRQSELADDNVQELMGRVAMLAMNNARKQGISFANPAWTIVISFEVIP